MAHPCNVCAFYPVPDGDGVACPHCHRMQYGNTCPRCGQNAPTLVRGLSVVCSACNAERGPLSGGIPMNVAGKPSKIGGIVSRVLGFGTLFGTAIVAALGALALNAQWTIVGFLLMVFALVGAIVSSLLLFGGRKLSQHGDKAAAHAREQAIYALAGNRGGVITAVDVAASLNIQHAEADAILTTLARDGTNVGVEIDGSGVVHYVFKNFRPGGPVRVDAGPVRVEAAAGGAGIAQTADQQRDEVRARVDQEYERLRAVQDLQKR